MSRLTLAQQLKQLEDEERPRTFDPEAAYTSLDSLEVGQREGDEGREHYLEVGPSRLRAQRDDHAATLLGDKYAGKSTGRMKIFDDDEEEDEEDDDAGLGGDETGSEGDDAEESDEELDGEEDEEDDGGSDEDQDEEEDESDEDAEPEPKPKAAPAATSKQRALDPLGSLREARQKDIEKGQGIRKQKALFDSLITLRITFQKALTASTSLSPPLPADPSGGLEQQRLTALRSLADLNEKLLELRTAMVLPGAEVPSLRKRKRGDNGDVDEEYLRSAAKDSLALVDAQRPQLLSILNKWSSKINAASMAVTSKAAGSSKFLQGSKGQTGVVEAIEAGIAHRKESDKTFMESEEAGYRLLLKEVIESRGGASGGADLTHLRREKKKKREAERGGSKGRKLRYTVHEKAQNYAVPIPLANGWNDDQMDELFSSLLGGAGMKGAGAEVAVTAATGMSSGEDGLSGLGGLRVF